ncbi:hypothetical protein BHE74_00029117 [Ensete ventricosum]|nr:hypothetical protein BHE74_00029117 [Ensete ventricosum]
MRSAGPQRVDHGEWTAEMVSSVGWAGLGDDGDGYEKRGVDGNGKDSGRCLALQIAAGGFFLRRFGDGWVTATTETDDSPSLRLRVELEAHHHMAAMHPYDLVLPDPRFFSKKNRGCLLSIVVRLQIAGRKRKRNSSRNKDLNREPSPHPCIAPVHRYHPLDSIGCTTPKSAPLERCCNSNL